jgi:trehalose/maltose transport system permease protein
MSIPAELDEAARVDGCTHFQAFRWVIMPVMWPGVITTGLFSFLLAYNDFLVTSLLLDAVQPDDGSGHRGLFQPRNHNHRSGRGRGRRRVDHRALFLLVMVFQRQIVSGLTAGAVKG